MAPWPSAEGLASPGVGVLAAGAALLGVCCFLCKSLPYFGYMSYPNTRLSLPD